MHQWRPKSVIQVKALGLVWFQGRLLATEVNDDDGTLTGVRPLGGTVEFGETWRETLIREFREELGIEVKITGAPLILENIYQHCGETGHEVVFLSTLELQPDILFKLGNSDGPIEYLEDNGLRCRAGWFDLATLDCGGAHLYPRGLKHALASRIIAD